MCDWAGRDRDFALCGINGVPPTVVGRAGALRTQELAVFSSVEFAIENRREMMYDQFEIYRRGVDDAARVRLTSIPPPVIGTPADHDYMTDYPRAHVIPVGNGQRSDAEAKRLVDFLLDNDIEVSRLRRDYRFGGQVFAGGLVRRADEPGPARVSPTPCWTWATTSPTASPSCTRRRVVEQRLPVGRRRGDHRQGPALLAGDEADRRDGRGRGRGAARQLRLVRARGRLPHRGADDQRARRRRPCGPARHRAVRDQAGRHARRQRAVHGRPPGLSSAPPGARPGCGSSPSRASCPTREPIERVPRVACLCSAYENWALEARLGFSADRWTTPR